MLFPRLSPSASLKTSRLSELKGTIASEATLDVYDSIQLERKENQAIRDVQIDSAQSRPKYASHDYQEDEANGDKADGDTPDEKWVEIFIHHCLAFEGRQRELN